MLALASGRFWKVRAVWVCALSERRAPPRDEPWRALRLGQRGGSTHRPFLSRLTPCYWEILRGLELCGYDGLFSASTGPPSPLLAKAVPSSGTCLDHLCSLIRKPGQARTDI